MNSNLTGQYFKSFSTNAIHVGSKPDPHTGAVIPPISLSSTFAQKSPGNLYPGNFEYSRSSNPTRQNFEAAVAAAEGGKFGLAFASGSAVLGTITSSLGGGAHIVAGDDVYGGTNRYFRTVAVPSGCKVDLVDTTNLELVKKTIQKDTKMLWVESPTNPLLKISDIRSLSKIAHEINPDIIVVVDNTFLSPFFQRPLDLGADIVIHSVSKYINGHSDVVMGVLALNSPEWHKKLTFFQNAIGMIPSPFDCYLAHRGLKTLAVRMRQHEKNAIAIATFLEAHDKIEKVSYPGLASHPQHELAKQQQTGFGGIITAWLKGDLKNSREFLEGLDGTWTLAESLGGIESLIEHPAIMTHASVPADQRLKLGISDSLIRFSCGIEDIEDIKADLEQALAKVNL